MRRASSHGAHMDLSAETDQLAGDLFTARLHLRRVTAADAPALCHTMGDYEILQWTANIPHPFTLEDARANIARHARDFVGSWLILINGRLVGGIALNDQLGYWLIQEAWGHGIATEAAEAVVDYAFGTAGFDVLRAGYFTGNDASLRTLAKLGFAHQQADTMPSKARGPGQYPGVMMRLDRAAWQAARQFDLRTKRLRLRALVDGDAPRLSEIGGVPAVAPMMLSLTVPWAQTDVINWISASALRGRPGFRVGIEKDGQLIGVVGLGPRHHGAPLMYFIAPDHWRQGYAREAVSAFIAECFDRFEHLTQMTADHFTDNPASGALLRQLGFAETGQSIGSSAARVDPAPVIDYRLTRTDWEARQ